MKIFYILSLFLSLTACSKSDLKPVTVQTQNGNITYRVEVADTKQKMIQGLMYRKHLKKDSGMIFIFNEAHPQPISMWMKNTFISLDMLFIDSSYQIIGIAQNTEPLSLKTISPTKKQTRFVIELNAGEVAKHGIQIGDKITF